MQYQFSFKNMDTSDAVTNYAEGKIAQKIEKFSTKPISAHVTFSIDSHMHVVHCNVKGGDGFNFDAISESGDMYSSIDLLIDKLETQLKKHKEKLKNHKFQNTIKSLKIAEDTNGEDYDAVPVDAGDLLKFEKKRKKN